MLAPKTSDISSVEAAPGFLQTARPTQIFPKGASSARTWLFLGGRGSGKTRAGAEWLRYAVLFGGCQRAALVAPTLGDAREVMLEGPSGLIAIEQDRRLRPKLNASRRRLEWPNGAVGYLFSSQDPDSLRGPQFDVAWCDELAAWTYGNASWDMLQMGLRLGPAPRCVATTTPRPSDLIKRLATSSGIVMTRARTLDNLDHLAPSFLEAVQEEYGGTALGRQELDGDLLEDPEGAKWRRGLIDEFRVRIAPNLFEDIIVAVDPPATSGQDADACGIIAAGSAFNEQGQLAAYILRDSSEQGLAPIDWARRVVETVMESGATRVVAEANQGGELIKSVLDMAGCAVPVQLVHARLGKSGRAVPISALYSQGRVHHVGTFSSLEDEMCRFGAPGFQGSPDRLDALVWAVHTLLVETRHTPRLRRL